jgi:site-specific DNA-methyltransferase (adenine-specific)
MLNQVLHSDAEVAAGYFPRGFVDTIVTSPPYYKLRDYKVEGQIGLEETPEEYIDRLVKVFRAWRPVLKKSGTLWINIADSYAASGKKRTEQQVTRKSTLQGSLDTQKECQFQPSKLTKGLKKKDLIGIPWLLALALRADGWYLRQDIIWHKKNPMPESVNDRCTKSHEYILLLAQSPRYYYNAAAIATPYKEKTLTTFGCEVKGNGDGTGMVASENWSQRVKVRKPKEWKVPTGWDNTDGSHGSFHHEGRRPRPGIDSRGGNQGTGNIPAVSIRKSNKAEGNYGLTGSGLHSYRDCYDDEGNFIGTGMANKRSVWTTATHAMKEEHFATFPPELIRDCILAGCPPGGVVADMFMGSGTVARVAQELERNYVGSELAMKYIKIHNKLMHQQFGMFKNMVYQRR